MKKGNTKTAVIYFILGMLAMLILDMIFHFNNSVQKEIDNSMNKAKEKIENILK